MPRAARPSAVRTMNGLFCPAPAPCPTTSAAVAGLLRYTFNSMRIHSIAAAVLVLTAAAAVAPTTASAQRLPTTVTPVHYDITVSPRLADAKFGGRETIKLRLSTATSTIVLNAAEITFGEVSISAGGRQQRAVVTTDATKEQATFSFPNPVPAGDADLTIVYDGI